MNIKEIKANGGATLNLELENANYTTGYMVSLPNYKCATQHLCKKNIIFIRDKYMSDTELIAKYKISVGIWYNEENNKWYIDGSVKIEDKESAIAKAKEFNQLAIWDIANGKEIRIKGAK